MIANPLVPRPDEAPILIVSGCEGPTQRYRCFHHDEQLWLRGLRSQVIEQRHPRLGLVGLGCGTVILHRVAWDPAVQALVDQTRDAGGVVLFDIDDLVFEPEMTAHHHGHRLLPPDEQALYHEGVRRYRRTLLACDGAIVPTAFLAERVRALGKPAWISRNCLDLELVRLSEEAAARRVPREHGRTVVGYASGSRTHDEDFAEAAGPALRRVMDRHADVVLQVVGPLELGPRWAGLDARVERLPAVDWRELPGIIAGFDISLAPLELDNPFCQAKSELKWLEASACGVPSVAVATEAFKTAIDEGRTGLLATEVGAWEGAIERLVVDEDLRRTLGAAARVEAESHRTTAAQAQSYEATLAAARAAIRRTPIGPSPPAEASAMHVNILVPEPMRGSGGHASILRMAGGLIDAGHRVTLHADRGPLFRTASDDDLSLFCRTYFAPIEAEFRLGRAMATADAAIATGWSTALAVAEGRSARARLYFVQDFEPYLESVGYNHWVAESSYRLGLDHITLGPWLADRLRTQYRVHAESIDFGVDKSLYFRPGAPPDRPRVVFYARPSTPRRGTQLGMEALGIVKAARPDAEIVLYGTERRGLADFDYTLAGVLPEPALAALFRSATVGLVLSYTNMSLVPPELMASDCVVVAVDVEPVRWFLRDGENSRLCASEAEDLAAGILTVLADEPLRVRLLEGGHATIAGRSWQRSMAQFESLVRAAVDRAPHRRPPSKPPVAPTMDALSDPADGTVELHLGEPLSFDLDCRLDGLCRVDVRFGAAGERRHGLVVLRLREHEAATEDLATATVAAADLVDGAWHAFEFQPLAGAAGRVLHVRLEALGGDEMSTLRVAARLPLAGDEIARIGHRSFAREPSASRDAGLDPALAHLLRRRERDAGLVAIERARLGRSRVRSAVRAWRRLMRAMPPPHVRPWPETLSVAQKVGRALRVYGPLAVLREAVAYRRWHARGKAGGGT